MKKAITLAAALLLLFTLCACGVQDPLPTNTPAHTPANTPAHTPTAAPTGTPTAAPTGTPGDLPGETAQPTGAPTGTPGTENADLTLSMGSLLAELHAGYLPATTGSSVTGACYAARLADLFTEYGPDAETAGALAAQYYADNPFTPAERALYARQLAGVADSFAGLCANGWGVLESGGYIPTHSSWEEAALTPLFDAMARRMQTMLYAELLDQCHTVVSEGWDMGKLMADESGLLSVLLAGRTTADVGYRYADLDADGTVELLLGLLDEDEFYQNLILGLYTVDDADHAVVPVFRSAERDRYYYAGGDRFAHVGSSGAADSMDTTVQYADAALQDLGAQTESYQDAELVPLSCFVELG